MTSSDGMSLCATGTPQDMASSTGSPNRQPVVENVAHPEGGLLVLHRLGRGAVDLDRETPFARDHKPFEAVTDALDVCGEGADEADPQRGRCLPETEREEDPRIHGLADEVAVAVRVAAFQHRFEVTGYQELGDRRAVRGVDRVHDLSVLRVGSLIALAEMEDVGRTGFEGWPDGGVEGGDGDVGARDRRRALEVA